ncbi:MAG: hypothetical protein ACKN9I_03760, partial [Alphaproteobacteria bacterium]
MNFNFINILNFIKNKFFLKQIKGGFKRGFSFNDISVLISTALVVATTSIAISEIQNTASNVESDAKKIEVVYKAMGRFMLNNKRLPCPAKITKIKGTDADYGSESISSGNCLIGSGVYSLSSNSNLLYGAIPVQALGLSAGYMEDQYRSKLVYIIDKRATLVADIANTASINLGTLNDDEIIKIKEDNAIVDSKAIFVIMSLGKNKYSSFSSGSSTPNSLPSVGMVGELENSFTSITGNVIVADNVFTKTSKNDESFDDYVFSKNKTELVKDYNADFLIPCIDSGNGYGNINGLFNQVVYATSNCLEPNQNLRAAKRCGKNGVWVFEKSCPCNVVSAGVETTNVANGAGSLKCSKSGYNGVMKYVCNDNSSLQILETCKKSCLFSANGLSQSTLPHGFSNLSCNQANFVGEFVVNCDNGVVVSSVGGCIDSRCSVGGYSGMRPQIVNSSTSSNLGLCDIGYDGSYSYSCEKGVAQVTDLCFENCQFSTIGISLRSLKQGKVSLKCDNGYSGSGVDVSCNDGKATIESGMCYLDGNCSVGVG